MCLSVYLDVTENPIRLGQSHLTQPLASGGWWCLLLQFKEMADSDKLFYRENVGRLKDRNCCRTGCCSVRGMQHLGGATSAFVFPFCNRSRDLTLDATIVDAVEVNRALWGGKTCWLDTGRVKF